MAGEISLLLGEVADLRRRVVGTQYQGVVDQVRGDKIRVRWGTGAKGQPVLSPWLDTSNHRGGARERRYYKKGQNVTVATVDGEMNEAATVSADAPNQTYPPPDQADDAGPESETYQLDKLHTTKKTDCYIIYYEKGGRYEFCTGRAYLRVDQTRIESTTHHEGTVLIDGNTKVNGTFRVNGPTGLNGRVGISPPLALAYGGTGVNNPYAAPWRMKEGWSGSLGGGPLPNWEGGKVEGGDSTDESFSTPPGEGAVSNNEMTETLTNYPTLDALAETLTNYPTLDFLTQTLTGYPTFPQLTDILVDYPTFLRLDEILADYLKIAAFDTAIANYTTTVDLMTLLASYTTNTALATTLANYATTVALNAAIASSATSAAGNFLPIVNPTYSGRLSSTATQFPSIELKYGTFTWQLGVGTAGKGMFGITDGNTGQGFWVGGASVNYEVDIAGILYLYGGDAFISRTGYQYRNYINPTGWLGWVNPVNNQGLWLGPPTNSEYVWIDRGGGCGDSWWVGDSVTAAVDLLANHSVQSSLFYYLRANGATNPQWFFQGDPATGTLTLWTPFGHWWAMRAGDWLVYNNLGPIAAHGLVDWSDERGKRDITPEAHGLDIVNQLQPIEFARVTSPHHREVGFSGQAVKRLFPEATLTAAIENEPERIGLSPTALLAVAVNAIKELARRLERLEGK